MCRGPHSTQSVPFTSPHPAGLLLSGAPSHQRSRKTIGMARKPARFSDSCPAAPGQTAATLLDDLLPLAEPAVHQIHYHAALLEVRDPSQLLELAADPVLRPFLLCRLAPNVALVDPRSAEQLAEALRRRGHTPKILQSV